MGDVGVFLLSMMIVLMVGSLVLGWINYKISKLKDEIDDVYIGKENAAAAIVVLEGLIWNLNALCKDHQKRLDILEAGHPDDEIDYGTVDDDGNITEIWFNGKRYVPEDKSDEDTVTFYADNKVIAETTKQDVKCCATCRHYRPGPDHTCTIRPWLRVTKACANNTHSACNNYAKAYTPTKGQVDYPYITYEYMSGNCKTEQVAQRLDELQRELQKFNFAMSIGACTVNEFERRREESMQNDT